MAIDSVTLSVMASALSGIAEEMGSLLVRSAYSSNIKERRDCSSALFDSEGRMVAQAEHIPVHLGAMPETVRSVMSKSPRPGDVFIVNDPYSGGSHIPDVTLVTPVAIEGAVIAYAATRAHHSDMGGSSPGSMPGGSTDIYQEGLVIPPVRLVEDGVLSETVMSLIMANSRTPFLRRGDFLAQIAANDLAVSRLSELAAKIGLDALVEGFAAVIAYAEKRTRDAISTLPDGVYRAETEIEGDGVTEGDIPIRVEVRVVGDSISIDFEGTAGAVDGNVNCPLAVTQSACYFATKVVVPKDIPSNSGAFAPITITAPEGSLVNARRPSAVVAANVETSSRIADVVLRALSQATGVTADGQGTMNVVVIGGPTWTYVETLAGGQGASAAGPGASGVHVAMTNTLNTPIESLELEYPMRVERYELRYGSGGAGKHRGGDGLVRSIRVLDRASLSLLTDRRRHHPQGLEGGGPGAVGRNLVGDTEIGAKVSVGLEADDVVTVETPGGGGWGVPDEHHVEETQ
ncbi:MAG: hydantoinase B/oxoprolinase family protein [Acidimicrobiia bacterium]|jgi:N-methylhydantoinase B